ncbi:12188_t:CDS:2, partial [Acaulospora morrowiae]
NELEVPISHYEVKGLTRPDESKAGEEVMCEEILSPAVYLTTLEEVPTPEDEEEPALEEPKLDLDSLTKKERVEVIKLFETREGLFAKELDELTQTDEKYPKKKEETSRSGELYGKSEEKQTQSKPDD